MHLDRIAGFDESGSIPRRLETGLVVTLALLVLAQFLTWLPGYLCRPYWADHDVFATLAQGWRRGQLPYRDLKTNQFPGELFLFVALDRTLGVDRPAVFYALDALGVLVLGLGLCAWSRRRFGSVLPGLIGALTFAGYYFRLDHLDTAQRDWHAALLATLGLMAAGTARGRYGSALLLAMAFCIRPQVVVFLPAFALALDERARLDGERFERSARVWLTWGIVFVLGAAATFLPLVRAGVGRDFLACLSTVQYGGGYNRTGLFAPTRLRFLLNQMTELSVLILPAAVALLAMASDSRRRRLSWIWLAAYAGALFYKPLSPQNFSYLDSPLMLVRAVLVAVLAALIVRQRDVPAEIRLAALLLTLCLGAQLRPQYSSPAGVATAARALIRGAPAPVAPRGVKYFAADGGAGPVRVEVSYPWRDYQALVAFLRDETDRDLPIANLLPHVPALTSVTNHPSLFRAESIAWLCVRRADEAEFLHALETAPRALVVWSPALDRLNAGQDLYDRDSLWPALKDAVRCHYEPWQRFGPFEIWTRRPISPPGVHAESRSRSVNPAAASSAAGISWNWDRR